LETPSAFSEFASPDVAIGFTCLAYHYEGLRPEDPPVLVSHMYQAMLKEKGPCKFFFSAVFSSSFQLFCFIPMSLLPL